MPRSRAEHVKHLLHNRKTPKKSKPLLEHMSSGVRNVTMSEATTEDVDRDKRLSQFLQRRRNDPDHVKKQIEKRKAKLGLNPDPSFPAR